MSRLDCSSAEVKAALEEVSNPSGSSEWCVPEFPLLLIENEYMNDMRALWLVMVEM